MGSEPTRKNLQDVASILLLLWRTFLLAKDGFIGSRDGKFNSVAGWSWFAFIGLAAFAGKAPVVSLIYQPGSQNRKLLSSNRLDLLCLSDHNGSEGEVLCDSVGFLPHTEISVLVNLLRAD